MTFFPELSWWMHRRDMQWLITCCCVGFSGLSKCECVVCVCECLGANRFNGCVRGGWGVFLWTGDGGRKCKDLWRGWLPLLSSTVADQRREWDALNHSCHWAPALGVDHLRDQSVRHISICLPEKVTCTRIFGFSITKPWSYHCLMELLLFEGCECHFSGACCVGLHHHLLVNLYRRACSWGV